MKQSGWTHRRKRKSRDPYLKLYSKSDEGATFVDQEGKFRYLTWEDVIAL